MDSPLALRRSSGDWIAWVGEVVLLAAVYFAFGRVGLTLAHAHENATLIWPPSGLALAALLLFGRRLWPGVALGALLVGIGSTSLGLLPALGVAVGNSLEALLGVTWMQRSGMRLNLARMRDVAAFLILGVLACTMVGATLGVASLWLGAGLPVAEIARVWLVWWLGDMGGALIVAPPLLMLVHGTPAFRVLFGKLEFWLAFTFLLATSGLAFFGSAPGALGVALLLPCFPVLVWVGTRLGSRGGAMASLVIVSLAIAGTAWNSGPFAVSELGDAMVLLWAFSIVIGISVFTLASVVEERDAAYRRYRAGEAERIRAERDRMLLLERERLTREMHDGLGGQLISVLSLVEREKAVPAVVAESLRRALDDIRIVIDSLDPETTDLPTSLGKLRARLTPLLERNGITLVWRVANLRALEGFAAQDSLHVVRVIQESVTNAMRHAAPSRVEVSVEPDGASPPGLRVRIRDDGVGLSFGSPVGRGLRNMRRRADELGGILLIERVDPGTRVELLAPAPGGRRARDQRDGQPEV